MKRTKRPIASALRLDVDIRGYDVHYIVFVKQFRYKSVPDRVVSHLQALTIKYSAKKLKFP